MMRNRSVVFESTIRVGFEPIMIDPPADSLFILLRVCLRQFTAAELTYLNTLSSALLCIVSMILIL